MDTGGESAGQGGLGGQGNAGGRTAFILFTDIYRSSHLWETFPKEYPAVLEQHNRFVEGEVSAGGGTILKGLGDGYIALFSDAADCVACSVKLQDGFSSYPDFADGTEFLVRVIGHGGPLRSFENDYYGPALNRASRICQVCHPGQLLISEKVQAVLPGGASAANGLTLIDLGQHRLRDLAEPEHLFQLDHPDFALHDFPPLPTLAGRPNNLVEQPNVFIGRGGELAELKDMLVGQVAAGPQRLITITAPGGYGKSRLATRLCADVLDEYEHGVFEVLLAPVGDHSHIVSAVADALGFRFYGKGAPKDQLIDYLREKELLISFDNFEHVMEGAALIGDILKEASRVQVLVTSREPLRLSSEQVYPLGPLAVGGSAGGADGPDRDSRMAGTAARPTQEPQAGPPAPPIHEYPDAVLLFTDRAMLVKPSFALDDASLPQAQAICARLEGVPLAIELAAAWADSYSLDELLSEMDEQLELTARMRDVPERHRSVRASLDWSFGLLSDEQRDILRCLAVFKGGFFIEAAEAVVAGRESVRSSPVGRTAVSAISEEPRTGPSAPPEEPPSPPNIKHLRRRLAELSDKSWLFTREVDDKTRFFIRDAAAREYAWERLRQSPERQRAVIAHARYFSALMEQEGEKLRGPGQLEALRLLGLELQNIFEALDTLLNRLGGRTAVSAIRESRAGPPAPPEAESLLLPFARHLIRYLEMVSRFQEGLAWYERLVEIAERAGIPVLQIHAHLGHGQMLRRLSRYGEAEEAAENAKRLAGEEGDRESIAASLGNLGLVALSKGRYDEAKQLHQESLAISREIGDRYGIATSLNNLGNVAYTRGRYEKAEELYQESLAIMREIGNRYSIAGCLNNLASVAHGQGSYNESRELFNEALVINRKIGNRLWIAKNLGNLGTVASSQGRYDEAKKLHEESLAIRREIGDRQVIANSLNSLGDVAHAHSRYDEAKQLYQESLAIRREIGGREGIATSLGNLAGVSIKLGRLAAAPGYLKEALRTASNIGAQPLIPELLIITGCLMAETGSKKGEAHNAGYMMQTAILFYGAQHHAEQIGHTFDPIVQAELGEGLKKIQGERIKDEGRRMKGEVQGEKGTGDSGQGTGRIDQLKAQAEAMSLDELAEYALAALAELEPTVQTG